MTSPLLILGTDTDAGKTTFALLWLAAFAKDYEYWKPLESGDSDSERVRRFVPAARVHAPVAHFEKPCAPLLAARQAGQTIPLASELAARCPSPAPGRRLLIETFGSPFSPLNGTELQIALIQRLQADPVLISSSAVGAIGRTLQTLHALRLHDIELAAVVLIGPRDDFAFEQIARHWPSIPVAGLQAPVDWDAEGLSRVAEGQIHTLRRIATCLGKRRGSVLGIQYLVPSTQYSVLGTSDDLLKRDRRFVWHPYTSLQETDPPLPVVSAQDEFLTLADGRQVIDAISSWWTILHGHRHPVLMAALREAMERFDHVHFAGVTHDPAVELAELLLQSAPWHDGRVFYSDNGSTAVEVALKMAYQYWCHQGEPHRTRFIGFENGYHGDTFGAMAVSRDPVFFGRFEPLLFQADIVPLSAERLDDVLSRNPGKVAAVIIEPLVQGAGGMRMHTAEELRQLFEVARQHQVLIIADEAMTGGGRTGTLWAYQAAGIAPDVICAAKTLAGGVLPLAATLTAPQIVAAWDTADRRRTFFHGHSFTAHPLACAVAVANWKMLLTAPGAAARRIEAFWQEALLPLRDRPQVAEVRIRGLIAAVELKTPGGYLADVGRLLRRRCLDEGVLLRPLGSVLYALPPYCTWQQSLEQVAHAIRCAIDSIPRRPSYAPKLPSSGKRNTHR
jgi:adenosylmethionine-8-amino-7-oxononanoate aminotransferase